MLASLIRKVFHPVVKDKEHNREFSKATSTSSPVTAGQDLFVTGQEGVITLSNYDPSEDKLSVLLGNVVPGLQPDIAIDGSPFHSEDKSENHMFMDDVKVDVTLRTQLGQAPALMLLITDPGQSAEQSVREPVQVAICVEVGLNGRITVVDTAGLMDDQTRDEDDAEMQGTDDPEPKLQDIYKKIARVLEISQDLGILVEWVLRWLRQRVGSG